MPFFSVIIPAYNRSDLLREALASVLAQTFTDYEVIVVDDGSVEDLAATVAADGDRIRFFQQENSGPGTARNLGIQKARGEYVAFLDSDDVWFPWTLASYHEAYHKCGQPGFIAGNWSNFSEPEQLKGVQPKPMQCKPSADYYSAWGQGVDIVGCGVVVKTSALAATAGFFNGYVNAEDSDMWMKLGTVRGFAQLISPVVFGYRQTPSSVSRSGAKTVAGVRQMVLTEKAGKYPGDAARRRERWQILTYHLRPASLGCLKENNLPEAWWFYQQSFWWHVSLGRLKYLAAMPLLCLRSWVKLNLLPKAAKPVVIN